MKPYTSTGECNDQESLRANWRQSGNYGASGNYRRKKADRANKKTHRARMKRTLRKEAE